MSEFGRWAWAANPTRPMWEHATDRETGWTYTVLLSHLEAYPDGLHGRWAAFVADLPAGVLLAAEVAPFRSRAAAVAWCEEHADQSAARLRKV
jgi:hypothetical protein